jgi:hypothetical protein
MIKKHTLVQLRNVYPHSLQIGIIPSEEIARLPIK